MGALGRFAAVAAVLWGAACAWAGPDAGPPAKPCFRGGCSGELCTEKRGMVSPCIWHERFKCLKKAECARQPDGQCGFTPTKELEQCLKENPDKAGSDVQ